MNPEPKAKRTVEGDLGVYINSKNIVDLLNVKDIGEMDKRYILAHIRPIPLEKEDIRISSILTKKAVEVAMNRHVGTIKRKYGGESGFIAYGKDLSQVKYIIGTGGALTRLPEGKEILLGIRNLNSDDMTMMPGKMAEVLIDKDYIMACAGVLSRDDKEAAKALLKQSLLQ